jgi:hypothetical protein
MLLSCPKTKVSWLFGAILTPVVVGCTMLIFLVTCNRAVCFASPAIVNQAGAPQTQPVGHSAQVRIAQGPTVLGESPFSGSAEIKTPGGQEHQLQGWFCHWSGSSGGGSSYSHTTRAFFDGQGSFRYGSESSFSSGSGLGYGADGASRNVGTYRVSGNQVYLTFSDGTTEVALVHNRGADGTITELIYDGDLYAAPLCE